MTLQVLVTFTKLFYRLKRITGARLKLAQSSVVEILASAIVFVFLCLVALYESWKIPFAVMLSVPTGIFGALLAEIVTGNLASVYMQIGILVLIGLTAKNAILIVEFAKDKINHGTEPTQAAINEAVERLRPILMTSLAFVMACIPLAISSCRRNNFYLQ